ncbi:MAG: SPASM domain-containing protein [Proteobacteria bacterium]|nr:SPASM domain-containing protein [Pseudomonadota bacterium]
MRHVQVINRDNAGELAEMVRFGLLFRANRVNFKLASLHGGTEACAITVAQRQWLKEEGIEEARHLAANLGVRTNLHLFQDQITSANNPGVTTDMDQIGCYMGFLYSRITVDGEVLFCCDSDSRVAELEDGPFPELWFGDKWQALRERIGAKNWFPGCRRCGKYEQNIEWRRRGDESNPHH